MKQIFTVRNLGELEIFAKEIASSLDKGSSLYISGELGVGKTTLAKFLCSEFGVREKVTSPTFTILRRYWSEKKKCFVNHFDFFRITSDNDIEEFCDVKNDSINIIEWPEKASSLFNKSEVMEIKISLHQTTRRIEVLVPFKNHPGLVIR